MSQDVHTLSVFVTDPGADDQQLFIGKAPTDANGGGITILDAYAVNSAALAGAGTTFTFQLLTYSNAGTPAVSGTISNVIGSATQWGADVPQQFTISDAWVDGGEWIVCDYQELNAGNPTLAHVVVHYTMGRA